MDVHLLLRILCWVYVLSFFFFIFFIVDEYGLLG